jgi:ABC-type dipeptide/oligopeptide/nickel transport system permease subunit
MSREELQETLSDEQKKLAYYEASQWTLMRRRFSKHKVAVWMLYVVVLLYVLCLNCDFFAPYDKAEIHKDWVKMPPQLMHFGFVEGHTLPRLYVHPYTRMRNPVTLAERYYVDQDIRVPIRFFARGRPWKFLGLFETDRHFFGVRDKPLLTQRSDGGPIRATIARDPEAAALKYNHVTLEGADLAGAEVRPRDRLRVFPDPHSDAYEEYRIAVIDAARGTLTLEQGPTAAVTEPVRAELWRERTCFLLGTGPLGQDGLSRILYGGRISLLIGLTGVVLSFTLGIVLGGISGYFGGKIDMLIQRVAEVLMTVPKIPIWLAMAAAIPKNWTSLQVYFAMTLILACTGWTGLCRVVRGKLLALREEDYARAAVLAGATERRVIFIHLIPNFVSHIIASLTLRIPAMILAETSLSFLGLGLRPPIVSWGVLLQESNSVSVVKNQPWLLLPAGMVILTVLAFNFVGEGLRDAADPYAT